jgi:hypothetical protein
VALGASTRGVVQNLAVPHGFTLIIGGTSVLLLGQRGYPGALGVWLFIAGANLALVGWQVLLGAHRHPVAAPVSGFGVFNLAPTLTVPVVYAVTHPIRNDRVAFGCAGLLSVSCYVLLVGVLAAATAPRA